MFRMNKFKILLSIALLSLHLISCENAHILMLFPSGSVIGIAPIAEELSERGHKVTLVAPKKYTSMLKNLQKVAKIDYFVPAEPADSFSVTHSCSVNAESSLLDIEKFNDGIYRTLMLHKDIDQSKVSSIIADAESWRFTYPTIKMFQAPYVLYTSEFSGLEQFLSASGFATQYLYSQRNRIGCQEFGSGVSKKLYTEMVESFFGKTPLVKLDISQVESNFHESLLTREIEKEAALFFFHGHPSIAEIHSLPPAIIPLGAVHASPPKLLPPQLQRFADDAEYGLIVFSMGSRFDKSSIPNEILQTFLRVFNKVPQRIVWNGNVNQSFVLPSNMKSVEWLPQQDLLGHPNTKLLISFGGLMSVQESVYHSVPLLILPFNQEQRELVARVGNGGFSMTLDWDYFGDDTLFDSIVRLIYEPQFQGNASRVSKIMRDEMMPGKKIAAHWVEHVIRFNGTAHLQLASRNMPIYQIYMLDVYIFLSVVLVLTVWLSFKLFCLTWRTLLK